MSVGIVSKATLGRLPDYLHYLNRLPADRKRISSRVLGTALGFSDIQVRKDLASIGGKGKPRRGYEVRQLIGRIELCISSCTSRRTVIVGAGKLGRALLDYEGFSEYGLSIAAAFDQNTAKPVKSDAGKMIYPMNAFESYCAGNDIRVGIITVPKQAAQEVCDRMLANGFAAIWSFAPTRLEVPRDFPLREENLALSLAHLNQSF